MDMGAGSCWLVLGQMVGIYMTTRQQNSWWVQGSLNGTQEAKNVNELDKQFHSFANNGPQGYGNQESVGEVDFNLDTRKKSRFKASTAAASFKRIYEVKGNAGVHFYLPLKLGEAIT